MSRGKIRNTGEVCADCSCLDPTWASVNRGILICDECCSVHRSFGRHISQVRSLKKGSWNPTQLAMVHTLYNNGANSIWEHSLLDPANAKSGRRKPQPKDPVHPTKADFLRAKHQMLAFVYRPWKEDGQPLDGDFSKQLHSSVRTANLETSLRLLSLGADPNYFHPEKGNCPLHVAAKAGQVAQVELLVVYGADPGIYDHLGRTPVDYARLANHMDLADRLVECQFELTDRLAFYLCGRKPDHQNAQNFIIPEMADSLDLSELAKEARKRLQLLPNPLFEELAMDVYDEVDRRETDAIWLSTQNHSALVTDRCTVPFLPVNPEFSATRNQGRQKLARFNAREFATLIIDVLSDARRRQTGTSIAASQMKEKEKEANIANKANILTKVNSATSLATVQSNLSASQQQETSDDEPLYDSVASDEDYVLAEQYQILANQTQAVKTGDAAEKHESTTSSEAADGAITIHEYLDVKRALATSEVQVQHLIRSNKDMKQEIGILQNMVQKLMQENSGMRTSMQHAGIHPGPSLLNGHDSGVLPTGSAPLRSSRACQRPASMYEAREGMYNQRLPFPAAVASSHGTLPRREDVRLHRKDSGDADSGPPYVMRQSHHNTSNMSTPSSSPIHTACSVTTPLLQAEMQPACRSLETLPSQEEVVRKTEQITKRIQELLISAQEKKHESFIPCSERIREAVIDMASIFPHNPEDGVRAYLKQLTTSAIRLQSECHSLLSPHHSLPVDHNFVTQQVIQCAYDIAKAAKQLVTIFQ